MTDTMPRPIFGIDHGTTGAIAVLDEATGELLTVVDCPIRWLDGKRRCDEYAMAALLVSLAQRHGPPRVVGMEYGFHSPVQSRASAFITGAQWGLWRGIVATLGWPLDMIRPADWKRELLRGVPGDPKTKERNILAAERMFPTLEISKRNGNGTVSILDGRADAALIAEYARRVRAGGRLS